MSFGAWCGIWCDPLRNLDLFHAPHRFRQGRSDGFQGLPLSFGPDVAVRPGHSNRRGSRPPGRLSACGNRNYVLDHPGSRRMSQIVKPASFQGIYDTTHIGPAVQIPAGISGGLQPYTLRAFNGAWHFAPSCPPVGNSPCSINVSGLRVRKNKIVRLPVPSDSSQRRIQKISRSENWIWRDVPAVLLIRPKPLPSNVLEGIPKLTRLNTLKNSARN